MLVLTRAQPDDAQPGAADSDLAIAIRPLDQSLRPRMNLPGFRIATVVYVEGSELRLRKDEADPVEASRSGNGDLIARPTGGLIISCLKLWILRLVRHLGGLTLLFLLVT